MNNNENKRILYLDKLRFFAIMGVILIHTTTRVLERTSYNLSSYEFVLYLNQISRFAVPLFFLISGFSLEASSGDRFNFILYLKKRFSRILIPYLFWSLFYYFLIYSNNQNNLVYVLLTGNASYQLYFIPSLCIFYLIFPFLHIMRRRLLNYSMLILSIFQIWILYKDYFIQNLQFSDPIRISILGFFYFALGVLISRYREYIPMYSQKYRQIFILLFIAVGLYVFREGFFEYYRTYNINSFYSSWRPSTLIYSLFSGMYILSIFNKMNFHNLSKLSFFVYFVHVFILEMVWKYLGIFVNPSVFFNIGIYILVSGVSFLIAYLIHNIPHLSKITG